MKHLIYPIFIFMLFSCSTDDNNPQDVQDVEDVQDDDDDNDNDNDDVSTNYNIWNGPKTEFTKESGADPNLETSQDRITSSVAITRANTGGEIYNILLETKSTKNSSPLGTEWAIGAVSDISTLSF